MLGLFRRICMLAAGERAVGHERQTAAIPQATLDLLQQPQQVDRRSHRRIIRGTTKLEDKICSLSLPTCLQNAAQGTIPVAVVVLRVNEQQRGLSRLQRLFPDLHRQMHRQIPEAAWLLSPHFQHCTTDTARSTQGTLEKHSGLGSPCRSDVPKSASELRHHCTGSSAGFPPASLAADSKQRQGPPPERRCFLLVFLREGPRPRRCRVPTAQSPTPLLDPRPF